MKNKLIDLNDHLFTQLERLNDESITDADLAKEVIRSKEVTSVANSIVANAKLALEAAKFQATGKPGNQAMPKMLGDNQHG